MMRAWHVILAASWASSRGRVGRMHEVVVAAPTAVEARMEARAEMRCRGARCAVVHALRPLPEVTDQAAAIVEVALMLARPESYRRAS